MRFGLAFFSPVFNKHTPYKNTKGRKAQATEGVLILSSFFVIFYKKKIIELNPRPWCGNFTLQCIMLMAHPTWMSNMLTAWYTILIVGHFINASESKVLRFSKTRLNLEGCSPAFNQRVSVKNDKQRRQNQTPSVA